jgi:hypothetical protein
MKKRRSTEQFVMLPRSLLQSAAWRSQSIHARRLIDFLMLEHMSHGGRQNGFLVAPRRQLESFGIHEHFVSTAIAEAESVGLIDCIRGKGRAPSRYTLTWLPRADGAEPTDRWRYCEEHAVKTMSLRKFAKTRVASGAPPASTIVAMPMVV